MIRIYELIEKKFLTIEIEECPRVQYEYCGMSSLYPVYNWEIIKIGNEKYNIYFK